MNVWYHHPTIIKRRRTLQIAGLLTLCVALITTLFFASISRAAPGINQTISFQGRLLTSGGQPVPEGYYNIQFKIYEGGSGDTAGNPGGTLKWTETHINDGGNNGVHIKNGYFSVDLGALTAFGSQVDWNQDTLWLSMNIAGSSQLCETFGTSPCTADGEMTPMKRLTSAPYALNAGKVGGKTADELIHNGTSQQTANFNITGTGIAGTLRANTSLLSPLLDRADAGTLSIGTTNATDITIGSSATNQSISIGTGTGDNTVAIGSTSGASVSTIEGGTGGVSITSTGDIALNTDSELIINGQATFNGGLSVQSESLRLLTAVDNNGNANIGIGNDASGGYALDVTGDINSSTEYRIGGNTALTDSTLNFSGANTSIIAAADGQALQLDGDNGVRIGDGTDSGDPTLLTLDKGATAPSATGNAVLGSMYYDTTLGKVQCYEADGWGACSSSPDNFITLSPEYTNAVTNGSGIGDFTSDICSDSLDINDGTSGQPTICGTNETYNFYNWTTTETSAQTHDIYVTYQLPTSFTGFVEGSTSLVGRTDDNTASVKYQVYKNTSAGLTACGSVVNVSTGAQSTWQKVTATGSADPANCNFTSGDSLVIKISLTSEFTTQATNAYASTLSFAFSND